MPTELQEPTHTLSLSQHLEPWIQSTNEAERERSIECLLQLLRAYVAHSEENEVCVWGGGGGGGSSPVNRQLIA